MRKTQKSPILELKVPDLTVHERVKKGVTQQITSVIFSIEEMHSTSADTGLGNPSLLTRMMRMGSIMCTLSPVPDIVKFCFKYRSIGARPRLDLLQPTNRLIDVVLRAEVLRADGIARRLKRKKASTDRNRAQISNAPAEDQPAQNSNALAEEAKVLRVRSFFFCSCSILVCVSRRLTCSSGKITSRGSAAAGAGTETPRQSQERTCRRRDRLDPG